ncbi:hypothetical protein [Granulicella sibirica]|uniref:Uncharacterized protein n=1 Tax=Granulicella sibirica TaxID=2479048 RepID=A0A4Q0T6R4_9BACT|nr:hypothetical protein [Granulicella sibirica]RXH57808.1 hypothetical protein GRAN_1118 [Granulicella sibirica]
MAAKLEIRDLADRLEYRVTQRHTRTHLFLRALFWMILLAIPIGMAGHSPLFAAGTAGIFIFAAFADVTRAQRGTDVTFTVTERDIISHGYTQNEYHPLNRWRTQAPDLAWREGHSSGENGPVFPQGVYSGNDCVLPLVTMEEGHRIVTAIYSRYPDTAEDSRYDHSSIPSQIITLGISKY